MWPQTSRIRKLLIARQLVCLKTTCNSYSRLIIALTDKNYKYSHLQVLPNAPPLPIRISSGSGLFSVTQRSRTNICSDHEQFRYCKTLKNEFAHQIQRSPACKCIILCCSQNLGTPCICQQFYKSQNRNLPIKSKGLCTRWVVWWFILCCSCQILGTPCHQLLQKERHHRGVCSGLEKNDGHGCKRLMCFVPESEEMKGRMKNLHMVNFNQLWKVNHSDLPVYGKLAKCWTRELRSRPSCSAESVIFLSFFRCTLFNIFGSICVTLVMASSFCGSFPCL